MKKVVLKSITMHNFRGAKDITTEFDATETRISGRNGSGKSRHFDAFIWCLFGKDSDDRADFEVKTRTKTGEELHNVESSVTIRLDVDGTEHELKRAIVENWVKPHGQTERVFKGNTTNCFINGTPLSVTEYTARVNNIIDATLFKMLTNPKYFVGLNWKVQREQLMQIVGVISDNDIIAEHPEYAELLDKISGKSLNDYRKEIAERRKRLNAELAEIQPRIDQTERMIPEAVKVDELKKAIAEADAEIADIDKQISDVTAAIRATFEAEQERAKRISDLKIEKVRIEMEDADNAMKAEKEANAERNKKQYELAEWNDKKNTSSARIVKLTATIEKKTANLEELKKERESLLADWHKENDREFSGNGICPTCGQPLPAEMLEKEKAVFVSVKLANLDDITKRGTKLNDVRESVQKEIAECEAQRTAEKATLETITASIEGLQTWLNEHPVVKVSAPNPAENARIKAIQAEIDEILSGIHTDNAGVNTDALQAKKRDAVTRRDGLRNELAKNDQRERGLAEIARLEKYGKEVAQKIADIEKEQNMADGFVRTRVAECETRINALFTMVTFRLFDYTQEGNVVETCVPLINGVPYPVANSAAKINAGLDIINALCRHYDTAAPIFIDNAESINAHIPTQSQIVDLIVTDGDLSVGVL